eukprot:m.41286 g.41286  ORF g.41286 m.41286 type:complete len:51 (+) comp6036_c0_seq2:1784-1936(+)
MTAMMHPTTTATATATVVVLLPRTSPNISLSLSGRFLSDVALKCALRGDL